jgi:outer membrane protein insertion porin family
MNKLIKLLSFYIFYILFFYSTAVSEIVNKIEISGNERISNETIAMFSDVKIGNNLNNIDLNNILKNLYETNFFNNVSIKFIENILSIEIEEAPLIQNINIIGVKAKKFKDLITNNTKLKAKSSFNKSILAEDLELIKSQFRIQGFYFAEVDAFIEELENNLVNIEYKVNIGDKSKISKISFIGDKIYKNKKLKIIIFIE